MKPVASQAIYLVMDCYPMTDSGVFRDFAGAMVGCWVRSDVCGAHEHTEAFARRRVSAAGWRVVSTLVYEEVSSNTYVDKSDGREFFEQAEIDGFVAHFHVRAREFIGELGDTGDDVSESLVRAADSIAIGGGFSLFCERDGQWANGVTPQGDEFLPFWISAEDAAEWIEFWPDYEVRGLTADELLTSDLLGRINAAEMWVAVGIGKRGLLTCHSRWPLERVTSAATCRGGLPDS
ncbi:MAG: hypothetical protein HY898_18915 [Deltaproteobacteria bacterium]|nr:hypothetical protein [Deltaproteobacteria bacterium]